MSTPSDDQPTRVLPQPDQPSATAAPATRRTSAWHRHVPARIGRARTSTLVISALFAVLFVFNLLLPRPDSGTTDVVLPSGETVPVPNSLLPSDARTTAPPTPTSSPPAPTSEVPVEEDEEPVSTPSRTATRTPTPTPTPTRAPSPTSETTADEATEDETTEPTGTGDAGTTATPTE